MFSEITEASLDRRPTTDYNIIIVICVRTFSRRPPNIGLHIVLTYPLQETDDRMNPEMITRPSVDWTPNRCAH